MFCSATPISIYRSGYFSLNASMRVLSARSAHSATTCGLLAPSSSRALPNPSRVCAIFGVSLMFALYFALHRAQFGKKLRRFLFVGCFAVPVIIKLYLFYSFAGDGVSQNQRRLFINRFRLLYRADNRVDIVPVRLQHMPAERLVLGAQVLQRHHVFGHAVYLYVIAVDERGKVGEFVCARKHRRLPRVACIPGMRKRSGCPCRREPNLRNVRHSATGK